MDEKKQRRKEINHKYYMKHKEKRYVLCECGKQYTKNNKSAHLKTKKHIKIITTDNAKSKNQHNYHH